MNADKRQTANGRERTRIMTNFMKADPAGYCKISKAKLSQSSVSFCLEKDFIRVYSCPFAVHYLRTSAACRAIAKRRRSHLRLGFVRFVYL